MRCFGYVLDLPSCNQLRSVKKYYPLRVVLSLAVTCVVGFCRCVMSKCDHNLLHILSTRVAVDLSDEHS